MSKENAAEEFLSNLGLNNMKLSDKDPACTLSGEESTLYDVACESDIDSATKNKLMELDNLSSIQVEEQKLQRKSHKLTLASPEPSELQSVSEAA